MLIITGKVTRLVMKNQIIKFGEAPSRATRYPIVHAAIEALSIIISVSIILVPHVTVAD